MDLVLLLPFGYTLIDNDRCFNPYFNGSSTSTIPLPKAIKLIVSCFNPYFNGSSTSTII